MAASVDLKGSAKGALIGGVAAGVLCVVLYFVGAAMGADFVVREGASKAMGIDELPFFQPMVNCLLAALISVGVLAGLGRINPDKAWSVYLFVAVVVFIVEAYMPFWAFADTATIVALQLMHVVATVGIVGGIHRFGVTPG